MLRFMVGWLADALAVAGVIFSVLLRLSIQNFVGQIRFRSIMHIKLLFYRVIALDTCAWLLRGSSFLLIGGGLLHGLCRVNLLIACAGNLTLLLWA
jgi:hypothetical protein